MTTSVEMPILPCEVRQYIWSYCDKPSLKVLSKCSKSFYAEVKPFVWKRVEVSWRGLTKELFKKPNPNFRLISCLVLGAPSRGTSNDRSLSLGHLNVGFVSFLQNCEQLRSLTICKFLPADALSLMSEMMVMVMVI